MATTDTWDSPALDQPISADLPAIQRKFQALVKGDPSLVQNPPVGAKRLVEISSGNWQVQQYNGSTWVNLGKLQMDVDTVDGYHAAITPQANTIAVRNTSGKLEGDITGNAVSSDSAATLSETLPVNKGGTGATTSAQARCNLGVPPTSHASSATTHGLGSNLNYGHVRGDGETADVISGEIVVKDVLYNNRIFLAKSGLFGVVKYVPGATEFNIDTEDFDILLISTGKNTGTNPPGFEGWFLIRQYFYSRTTDLSACSRKQIAYGFYSNEIYTRFFRSGSGWYPWVKVVNETDIFNVVRTDDAQTITGKKTFENVLNVRGEIPKIDVIETDNDRLVTPSTNQDCFLIECLDKNSLRVAALYKRSEISGNTRAGVLSYQQGNNLSNFSYVYVCIDKEGNKWAEAPTPKADSNTNHIATTKWVRDNASPVGSLSLSFATDMAGYLLCHGAAVSRTVYGNLFAIIGTAFGDGDGSTTFNLPDFRDRTLWGANRNLMAVLEAGLPNISGSIQIGALSGGASGAVSRIASSIARAGTDKFDSTGFAIDASRSSNIYKNGLNTVQPPAIAVNVFIKY